MYTAEIQNPELFVKEFLAEYLSAGIGARTKREIDILVMNLLMKYGGLGDISNQDISILLQATEGRIKALRYEARLKYPPGPDYVKEEFLVVLTRSQFDFEKERVVFVIEDDYLRHAIQGRVKSRGMFTDTSFNTELVKIDRNALKTVIGEIYGSEYADNFETGLSEMHDQLEHADQPDPAAAFGETILKFVLSTAQSLALDFIKGRLGM